MQPWKKLIKPDDIDVVSPEGQVRCRVKGYYSGSQFVIDDMKADIRPGDEIRRVLPNGNEEAFFVEDPKYYDGHFGKHYQVEISRRGVFPAHTGGNYHINVSGVNARVNIGSQDASVNIINNGELFENIRTALSQAVEKGAQLDILNATISEMEGAKTHPKFLAAYQKFIASAADHMTVLAPFLPALAGMLSTLPHI